MHLFLYIIFLRVFKLQHCSKIYNSVFSMCFIIWHFVILVSSPFFIHLSYVLFVLKYYELVLFCFYFEFITVFIYFRFTSFSFWQVKLFFAWKTTTPRRYQEEWQTRIIYVQNGVGSCIGWNSICKWKNI